MYRDEPLNETVRDLFRAALASGAVTARELADAAGYKEVQSISQIANGDLFRPIAALAHLLEHRPEAFQAFANRLGYMATPLAAQQGHGDPESFAGWCAGFVHRHFKRKADGVFCHRDLADTINDVRRGMKRAGLFLVACVKPGVRA